MLRWTANKVIQHILFLIIALQERACRRALPGRYLAWSPSAPAQCPGYGNTSRSTRVTSSLTQSCLDICVSVWLNLPGSMSLRWWSVVVAAVVAAIIAPSNRVTAVAAGVSPALEDVSLLVGLRQPAAGLKALEKLFWDVADPKSPEFGRFRTIAQLALYTEASNATISAATRWLEEDLGASDVELLPSRDALRAKWRARAPLEADADIMAPEVPAALRDDHVDYAVLVRNKMPTPPPYTAAQRLKRENARNVGMPLDSSMGLSAQKAAYGVPADLVGDHPDNLQMVWGTATFGLIKSDLELFYQNYCPHCNISQVSMSKDSVWDGHTGDNTGESMLDTEYISGMTGNVRTLVANTNTSASTSGSTGFGVALLWFVTSDLGTRKTDLPLVLSMSLGSLSYASCDDMCKRLAAGGQYSYDTCWTYLSDKNSQVCMYGSQSEVDRISVELQKLGLRGVTITGSSGDGGSHFSFGPFEDGSSIGGALNSLVCKYMNAPVFPTASPYVLSVGGTQWSSSGMFAPQCSPTKPCGWSGGGGGFSWEFSQPPYQGGSANITGAYLDKASSIKVMCDATTYNGAGRGYPDVSSLAAVGIPLCIFGGCSGSGGTSASAPTTAGMLSLINDARLKAGLKSLGFINTRLYSLAADPSKRAELFSDIAFDHPDSSWDCSSYTSCTGCSTGFPALTGWDAATGFGQPLFPGLMKYLGSDDWFRTAGATESAPV